jgi:hypothetical protein
MLTSSYRQQPLQRKTKDFPKEKPIASSSLSRHSMSFRYVEIIRWAERSKAMETGRNQSSRVGQDREPLAVVSRLFERNSDLSAHITHPAVGEFQSSCVVGKFSDKNQILKQFETTFGCKRLSFLKHLSRNRGSA